MTKPLSPLITEQEWNSLGALATSFGRNARVYHVGFVVPDLTEGIAAMEAILGVPFTAPMELPMPVVHSSQGKHEITIRYAYSTQPAHVELIESVPGTLWDFDDPDRCHHLGVWTDDVAAESDRLAAMGMPATWWGQDEDTGHRFFSFHRTPFGFYIELVDSVAKPFYPSWFGAADPALGLTADAGAQA
jgi:Glyoxalase/Bleomycin resistance protein/Dioxygenase superfamily